MKLNPLPYIRKHFSWTAIIFILIIAVAYLSKSFIDSIWLDETYYGWMAQIMQQKIMHVFSSNAELVANLNGVQFYYDRSFPIFVVMLFSFFAKSFTAMRLMGFAFAIAGVIFTYLLGKKVKNEFTGIVAMLMVATHHWYYFLSLKGLTDVAVVSMILIYTYCFYNATKSPTVKNIIKTVVAGVLTILTKAQGMVIVPFTVVYLLVLGIKNWRTYVALYKESNKFKYTAIAVIGVIAVIGFLFRGLLKNYIKNAQVELIPPAMGMLNSLMLTHWITAGFILGIIFTFIYKKQEYALLWVLAIMLFVPIATYTGIEQRILLPVMAPAYILAVIGLTDLMDIIISFITNNHRKIISMAVVSILLLAFVIVPNAKLGKTTVEQRQYWYAGYPEAMDWVHNNIPWDGKEIFVHNFFACCNYNVGLINDDFRRVNSTARLDTYEGLVEYVEKFNDSTTYIMMDAWEPHQRPFGRINLMDPDQTNQNVANLLELGFKPVYEVKRPLPTDKGLQEMSVIVIFKRN